MSFPSGSNLLVTLQPGASPNTGPFDLYINNISSTNLIANDISKSLLSGSGYIFNAPTEVFRVWAKSDGSITTANVAILGNIPGTNTVITVTGSYVSSLNTNQPPAEVFLDNGYGLQSAGIIPVFLNSCPSNVGTGTGSISNNFNTLLVVKTSESSSEYIKFFPDNASTSVYFHHVGTTNSTFTNPYSETVCIDLSGGNYKTIPTNSINVYPTSSLIHSSNQLIQYLTPGRIIRVNGNIVYSGSSSVNSQSIYIPGNAEVEITSSAYISNTYNYLAGIVATSSLYISTQYHDVMYQTQVENKIIISGSYSADASYKLPALPGGIYWINCVAGGVQIQTWLFNGGGVGVNDSSSACALGTGGPGCYITPSPTLNGRVYSNIGLTSPINGQGKWYGISNVNSEKYAIQIDSNGYIMGIVSC